MNIEVIRVDYSAEEQAKAIRQLLNSYACDPMGGGRPLADSVLSNIVSELAKLPHAFSVMGFVDGQAAGLVNCFEGFSTFECKPLVNVHDMIVLKAYRGNGLSLKMLEKVEAIAIQKGCCKLTLEVLAGNSAARAAYTKFGFSGYELNPEAGAALFWHKPIDNA